MKHRPTLTFQDVYLGCTFQVEQRSEWACMARDESREWVTPVGSCLTHLCFETGRVEISELYVRSADRKRGIANFVMQELTGLADIFQTPLSLLCFPFGPGRKRPDVGQLCAWYRRWGFVSDDWLDDMVRTPSRKKRLRNQGTQLPYTPDQHFRDG